MKLGRSARSRPKIKLAEIVDVEKAKAFPVTELQTVDYSTLCASYPMFANDRLGDCTCAGLAHGKQVWNAMIGEPFTVTADQVIAMYEHSGYKPGDESTDQGWTLEAAAQYAMATGLQGKPDVVGYAEVNIRNDDEQQVAAELFGGLYVGAAMPASAQSTIGQTWTVTNGGEDAGSWGGHCLWKPKVDLRKGSTYITWGALQESDAAWDDAYVDEYLALVPADWEQKMPEALVSAGVVDFAKLKSLVDDFTK